MSKDIKPLIPEFGKATIYSVDNGRRVDIGVWTGAMERSTGVTFADFKAAVESEFGVRIVPADAVVIERSELPEVRREAANVAAFDGRDRLASRSMDHAPSDARRVGIALLAIAEYLAAHPPVDQAQVDAVKVYVREFAATNAAYPISHRDTAAADARADTFARWLVERFDITPKDGAR